jgi:hypothetical protein
LIHQSTGVKTQNSENSFLVNDVCAAAVCVFSPRSMDSLACLNIVGLAAVILLAAVAALLGVSAVASGTAHAIPMMPQWQLLGPTKELQLEAMAGVLPVILASYVVHQVGYHSHSCWIQQA